MSKSSLTVELVEKDDHFYFTTDIDTALSAAEIEMNEIESRIQENLETLKSVTPDCDKTDYILAVSIGGICGVMDIFLVGKPGDTPLGKITDKWFEEKTKDFAELTTEWDRKKGKDSLKSALLHLEKKFKVPYDQTGAEIGRAGKEFLGLDLTLSNHHFKSLSHNPTLLGLFFSILDQFDGTSHFVSDGRLITWENPGDGFELRGTNLPSKLFCAFVNWFGHIISDMSGSSSSKERGMGIPSPFWCWANDVIAIKAKLKITPSEFDKSFAELGEKLFLNGYDFRFQTTQAIPVIVNELIVRFIYSVRRMIKYFTEDSEKEKSLADFWNHCKPYSNSSVDRMLTVAHGTFCLVDTGDAVARAFITGGGVFNPEEFFMRFNLIGAGRFTISLFGELKYMIRRYETKDDLYWLECRKSIVDDYIEGLKQLSEMYDDRHLITFVDDFQNSNMYKEAFLKSAELAKKRKVKDILWDKSDIDSYFGGGNN